MIFLPLKLNAAEAVRSLSSLKRAIKSEGIAVPHTYGREWTQRDVTPKHVNKCVWRNCQVKNTPRCSYRSDGVFDAVKTEWVRTTHTHTNKLIHTLSPPSAPPPLVPPTARVWNVYIVTDEPLPLTMTKLYEIHLFKTIINYCIIIRLQLLLIITILPSQRPWRELCSFLNVESFCQTMYNLNSSIHRNSFVSEFFLQHKQLIIKFCSPFILLPFYICSSSRSREKCQ